MQFFKLVTIDQEVRWINLAQITRVTLAESQGRPILAILFSDPDVESKLTIKGGNPTNDKAIADLTTRLDALAGVGG